MKNPLYLILALGICLTNCDLKEPAKREAFNKLIFEKDFIEDVLWETQWTLARAKIDDPVRHGILWNLSQELHEITNSVDFATTEIRLNQYDQTLTDIEKKLSKLYDREVELKNPVWERISSTYSVYNQRELRALLQLHLSTVNTELTRLTLSHLIILDSLSISTQRVEDTIKLIPKFYNKTQFARLIIDSDTIGKPYDSLFIDKETFNLSKEITLQFKSGDGKWIDVEIKKTKHNNR